MNLQVKEYLLHKERRICADHGYKVDDKYLGGGATGRVFLARPTKKKIKSSEKLMLVKKRNEQLKVAIKICYADNGADCISALWRCLPGEIGNCNKCFGLPNVVNMLDVFVASKRIFMVMEFAPRGDLRQTFKEHICTNPKRKRYLDEQLAARYFMEIAKGVQQLHTNNIAHRDLKLDNILVTGDGQVKICDLGFSVAASSKPNGRQNLLCTTNCGTRGYVAPEVSKRHETPYNPFHADVWSMGVILFLMTNGYLPFDGNTTDEIYQKISDSVGQPLPFRKRLSLGCRELLNRLLERNSEDRPTVDEIVQDPWLAQHTLSRESPPNTEHLTAVSGNSVYKFQSTYVSHYLWQRMMLLDERRKFLLGAGNSPEDLRDAGILIALPMEDTGGMRVTEVWRLEENELRKSDVIPDPFKRKQDRNNEVLQDPWTWSPDVEEPTLGIRCVERVVTESPLLDEWREFMEKGITPKGYLANCMVHCNTVHLAENPRSPKEPFPKRDKAAERKAKFAAVRQSLLGFRPRNSSDEAVSLKNGSDKRSSQKSAVSHDATAAMCRTKNADKVVNKPEANGNLKEQIDNRKKGKKTQKSKIGQADEKLYSKAGAERLQIREDSKKSVCSPTLHDSKEHIKTLDGLNSEGRSHLKKNPNSTIKMQSGQSVRDEPDSCSKDKREKNLCSKISKPRNEVRKYSEAEKQNRVDDQICETLPEENPSAKSSKQKIKEDLIIKPVNPYLHQAVLEQLGKSGSDDSKSAKCRPHLLQLARRNNPLLTDALQKHFERNELQNLEKSVEKAEHPFQVKNIKVENKSNQMKYSQAKLLKMLKRVDLQKLECVAKISNTFSVVERHDPSKPSRVHAKLKEELLKARARSRSLVDGTIGAPVHPSVADSSLKKQHLRPIKNNSTNVIEQPPPAIHKDSSKSSSLTEVAVISTEVNLVVPSTESRQSNTNTSFNAKDGVNKPQESSRPLIRRPLQRVRPHPKNDQLLEFAPKRCPKVPKPPKADQKSPKVCPSVIRRPIVAAMAHINQRVEKKGQSVPEPDLAQPRAPEQPRQNTNISTGIKKRIPNEKSPQKRNSENEARVSKDVFSSTDMAEKIYAPRPPEKDNKTSARIKRQKGKSLSVHTCDKEVKSRATLIHSGKLHASNAEEGRNTGNISHSKSGCDQSQGDQQVQDVNRTSNHAKPRSVSNPPKEVQPKPGPPQAGNSPGVRRAFEVGSRRFGRILRQRIPEKGEPCEVEKADLRPVRPQGMKPDKLRKARVVQSSETRRPELKDLKARVEVVKSKPPADSKRKRSAILQRRSK